MDIYSSNECEEYVIPDNFNRFLYYAFRRGYGYKGLVEIMTNRYGVNIPVEVLQLQFDKYRKSITLKKRLKFYKEDILDVIHYYTSFGLCSKKRTYIWIRDLILTWYYRKKDKKYYMENAPFFK